MNHPCCICGESCACGQQPDREFTEEEVDNDFCKETPSNCWGCYDCYDEAQEKEEEENKDDEI